MNRLLNKLRRGKPREEAQRRVMLERHAPEHGQMDTWQLDDLMRDSPKFRERIEREIALDDGRTYGPSGDLHQDLFLGAHASGETRVRAADEMRQSHRFGRDVITEVFKTDAFKDAKPFMEGDELASALFTMGSADKLDELMRDKALQDQLKADEDQREAEERLPEIIDALGDARGEAKDLHDQGQPIPQELVDAIKGLTGEREELVGRINGAGPPIPIPTNVKGQIAQAAAEGKTRVDVWGAIAGSGIGDLEHATPDEALALTEAWMQIPDFMELCKLLGRVQRDFRAQEARNVIGGTEEITGIELGNNLTSTLPSELARLGNPLTQRSFLRDYQDESLLQFSTTGKEKVDMGPAVLLIDMSGSMGAGSRAVQAKAVAVGFVKLMHRKQRDAIVICFNGEIVWEHHFPKRGGVDGAKSLLALASLTPSGGTNITKAALRGEKIIATLPAFKRADVLVVTDGQCRYDDAAEQLRVRCEAAGIRRHGVAIEHQPAAGGWLLSFCDDAISVDDLTDATGDIVRAIS